jgi:undecaprenyl diphosphate synthase
MKPVPGHIGIIMDGNGRWASQRGKPRILGHRMGARAVRRTTEACVRLGLEQLTLYAFSTENWRRPRHEVDFLMRLFVRFLRGEKKRLINNGVRLQTIGRTRELPPRVQDELARTVEATREGCKMTLCLALNYGGRSELVDACRALVRRAGEGHLSAYEIDEALIAGHLYQPDMPPLDLIIRTGGEMRLSNFLLWQAAYAEFYPIPACWPDFDESHLNAAIAAFAKRERRFGAVPKASRIAG